MRETILSSLRRDYTLDGFIGKDEGFLHVIEQLKKIADKNISVLLIGETGTGKSRAAEIIHHYSSRYQQPFIVCNCGACPEALFESQLFGHVRGAFTGALHDHPGLVEEAHSGTLVLDEINSLNMASQVKLNQFLETGRYRRVGENQMRFSDARILAASNVDLTQHVKDGHFREDLYYRLSEYELAVPPLRQRRNDIGLLVSYFMKKYASLCPVENPILSHDALRQMQSHSWPGNIRELENFIKRLLIDTTTSPIERVDLPAAKKQHTEETAGARVNHLPWKEAKTQVIENFESSYLKNLLSRYQGVVTHCARHAGVHPSDFWKLMRKYDISADRYRNANQSHYAVY